jgi:hypothetical protein
MPVEDDVGEEAVHVGEHLGHEVPAYLPRVVPEAVGVLPVPREQKQAHVFEGVAAQDDRARLLHSHVSVGVHVLDAAGASA